MLRKPLLLIVVFVIGLNLIHEIAYAQSDTGLEPGEGISSAMLLIIGGLIASLTAMVKGVIPGTEYPPLINVAIVGLISAAVLGVAIQSNRINGDAFELLLQWVNFVMTAGGIRAVVTTPEINGKSLSDFPTNTGAGGGNP